MEASSSHLKLCCIIALSVALIQLYYVHGQGVVMLSPRGIAHVCKGDKFQLTCVTTTNRVLDWIITIPGNATSVRRSVSTSSVSTEIPLNSTRFIFSRTSELNAEPLVSTLLISSVSDGLNGTEVKCVVGVTMSSTVVNIINDKNLTIDPHMMEQFESDGVTVILEWYDHYFNFYYVSVTPNIVMRTNGSIHLKLKISYNTFYNVSILATPPCGQYNVTDFTELFYPYANCGNPADLIEDTITVIGQNVFPVMEGANVTFSCPPGLVLIGSNVAECMQNGEWEPDPRMMRCSATVKHFILDQTERIIVIASVTVSAIIAVIFFIIGLLCAHCCQKTKNIVKEQISLQHGSSEFAVVQQSNERDLELQENVSYASVQ